MHDIRQLVLLTIVVGILVIISAPALAQDVSKGADNFYKSTEVTMEKVTFKK